MCCLRRDFQQNRAWHVSHENFFKLSSWTPKKISKIKKSYYRQLSADIKIKSLDSPEGPKVLADKTGVYFIISILIFVEKCLEYDDKNYFSVWLRTSPNPSDINRFRSHTGKSFLEHKLISSTTTFMSKAAMKS